MYIYLLEPLLTPTQHRVTRAADMENHSGTGTWIGREVTSSYTRIEKKPNSRVVTVTIASDAAGTWDAGGTHFSPDSFGACFVLLFFGSN